MSFLRTVSTRRLLLVIGMVLVVAVGGSAIALAGGGGPKPPAKPLARAVRDALGARPVPGVTARIEFTNHLVDSAGIEGASPLLAGASGRLWLAPGGKVRIELQSDRGDAQLVADGRRFSFFDGTSNTVYRGSLPAERRGAGRHAHEDRLPSLARVQQLLRHLAARVGLSGALPGSVAGRPAYTLRVSPKRDGGLLGAAEASWDFVRGVPLRAAVYAAGSSTPVLELKATQISFGPVAGSTFTASAPAGAKVTEVSAPAGRRSGRGDRERRHARRGVSGARAVGAALPFRLAAPSSLAGMPRGAVRLVHLGRRRGALVFYGRGLGGLAVLEAPAPTAPARRERSQLNLPPVSINGAPGQELDTALGTLVRFTRGGVSYTVAGSVKPAVAQTAARALTP